MKTNKYIVKNISVLNIPRDDPSIIKASRVKMDKVKNWLIERSYDALILSRRENFFWLTTGGDPIVVNSSENGIACLVITPKKHYLVSHVMDATRLAEEQIPEQNYKIVDIKWYDGNPSIYALKTVNGRIASDSELPGTENQTFEITDLHYPLVDIEIERLRWLGSMMNDIYTEMKGGIKRGMTEVELAAEFKYLQSLQGIASDVLIVGSDERIFKYRHPMPTEKTIDKYVMLHSAARKWGLHAPITRSFHFSEPPDKVMKAFQAVALVQAATFTNIKNDTPYKDILEIQKTWYARAGYPGEWQNHFQGGPTGYVSVNATNCLRDTRVKTRTAFEWFITVPGAKTAELSLLSKKGLEILSCGSGDWPLVDIKINESQMKIPGICIIE